MSKQFSGQQGSIRRLHSAKTRAAGLLTPGLVFTPKPDAHPTCPGRLRHRRRRTDLRRGFLEKIDQGLVEQVDIDQERGIAYVILEGDTEEDAPREVMLFTGDRKPRTCLKSCETIRSMWVSANLLAAVPWPG